MKTEEQIRKHRAILKTNLEMAADLEFTAANLKSIIDVLNWVLGDTND